MKKTLGTVILLSLALGLLSSCLKEPECDIAPIDTGYLFSTHNSNPTESETETETELNIK
jgi:Skp family chaperone for outer membrane proteins